eukprot:4232543-Pleurochrysis_carterae.AAC.2
MYHVEGCVSTLLLFVKCKAPATSAASLHVFGEYNPRTDSSKQGVSVLKPSTSEASEPSSAVLFEQTVHERLPTV